MEEEKTQKQNNSEEESSANEENPLKAEDEKVSSADTETPVTETEEEPEKEQSLFDQALFNLEQKISGLDKEIRGRTLRGEKLDDLDKNRNDLVATVELLRERENLSSEEVEEIIKERKDLEDKENKNEEDIDRLRALNLIIGNKADAQESSAEEESADGIESMKQRLELLEKELSEKDKEIERLNETINKNRESQPQEEKKSDIDELKFKMEELEKEQGKVSGEEHNNIERELITMREKVIAMEKGEVPVEKKDDEKEKEKDFSEEEESKDSVVVERVVEDKSVEKLRSEYAKVRSDADALEKVYRKLGQDLPEEQKLKLKEAEEKYLSFLSEKREELVNEIRESKALSQKEKEKKISDILKETVALEATKLYDEKTSIRLKEKEDTFYRKALKMMSGVVESYQKLSFTKKMLITGALIGSSALVPIIGGSTGAAIATASFLGMRLHRGLAGASMGTFVEAVWKKKQEKGQEKMVRKEFADKLLNDIDINNEEINKRLLDLEKNKDKLKRRRYLLAVSAGIFVGSGAMSHVLRMGGAQISGLLNGETELFTEAEDIISSETEIAPDSITAPETELPTETLSETPTADTEFVQADTPVETEAVQADTPEVSESVTEAPEETVSTVAETGIESLPESVLLEQGENPWKMIEREMERVLERPPTNSEIMEITKEVARSSDISVPEWDVEGSIDHTKLPPGYELRLGDNVRERINAMIEGRPPYIETTTVETTPLPDVETTVEVPADPSPEDIHIPEDIPEETVKPIERTELKDFPSVEDTPVEEEIKDFPSLEERPDQTDRIEPIERTELKDFPSVEDKYETYQGGVEPIERSFEGSVSSEEILSFSREASQNFGLERAYDIRGSIIPIAEKIRLGDVRVEEFVEFIEKHLGSPLENIDKYNLEKGFDNYATAFDPSRYVNESSMRQIIGEKQRYLETITFRLIAQYKQ